MYCMFVKFYTTRSNLYIMFNYVQFMFVSKYLHVLQLVIASNALCIACYWSSVYVLQCNGQKSKVTTEHEEEHDFSSEDLEGSCGLKPLWGRGERRDLLMLETWFTFDQHNSKCDWFPMVVIFSERRKDHTIYPNIARV